MSDAIWIAVIASLLAPPLMVWMQARTAAAKEKRDYARQDAVAAKAEEAAKLLLDQQAEAARLLKENNKVVSEQAATMNREITKLTGMLDGNFTKLMEDNLDAKATSLVLARQLLAMTHEAGHETTPESIAEIDALQSRINELTTAIAKRKHTEAVTLSATYPTGPVPVTDNRTAVAAERSAKALERAADAAEDKNA